MDPLGKPVPFKGTAVPAVLLEYPFLRLLTHELGLRFSDFFRQAVWPTTVPAAIAFVPLGIGLTLAGRVSAVLLIVAVLCGVLYLALFWTFSLAPDERRDFLRLVREPLQRRTEAVPSDL